MTLPGPIRAALAGTLHGVAEWLPVSSSGHVALLIDAARWPEADPTRRTERRAIEVALHTGSLLPIGSRVLTDLRAAAAPGSLVGAGALATGVTAVIGGVAGPLVEHRFAGPRSVAAGLIAGSVALVVAERASQAHPSRSLSELGRADVVAVGVAQGMAIWPGVSRRAATLAAARARGLSPEAADALSWGVGLPTLAAATVWQFRRSRASLLASPGAPIAGVVASALVGYASRSLPARTASWPASRWAAWRSVLAALTLARAPTQ